MAIVNDVISAGSAVKGTLHDLQSLGATVVCVASMLVMGTAFLEFAATEKLPVEALAEAPSNLWRPEECPLCASGVPVEALATQ